MTALWIVLYIFYRPVKLVKQVEGQKFQSDKVQILREPKGPDGTNGFDQPR